MDATKLLLCLVVTATVGCPDTPSSTAGGALAPAQSPTPIAAQASAGDLGEGDPPRSLGPPVRQDGTIYAESELMGTHVSINVWLDPDRTPVEAGAAVHTAFNEIARVESIMSEWQPDSELSRFNRAAGGPPVVLSADLFAVLKRSREISEMTSGAFDVTFHGVGQLWKFEPGARPPAPAAVAKRLALVDWRSLELDPVATTARLQKAGMMIGLGAIAKGYAVDRASAILRERGFRNHVVEAGGDTYASGTKGGKPWMVGVQDPSRAGVVGAIPASDIAVVTSGDYQRFFEFEGHKYAHILDPKTGYPVLASNSAASITLVAANATDADAFATAVAIMGPERAMAFVEAHPGLEAVILTHDGDVRVSSGLRERFIDARSQTTAKPVQPGSGH